MEAGVKRGGENDWGRDYEHRDARVVVGQAEWGVAAGVQAADCALPAASGLDAGPSVLAGDAPRASIWACVPNGAGGGAVRPSRPRERGRRGVRERRLAEEHPGKPGAEGADGNGSVCASAALPGGGRAIWGAGAIPA